MTVAGVLAEPRAQQPIILMDCAPLPDVARTLMRRGVLQGRPSAHVIPFTAANLAGAAYAGWFHELSPYESYVVWLDDLSPGDLMLLTPDVLDIVTSYAAIAATMCARWSLLFEKDTADATADARYVLTELAERVTVPVTITPGMPPEPSRSLNPAVGVAIAESARRGEQLLTRFQGSTTQHPVGQELVQAAVDARRAGVHRGLSAGELRTLLMYGRAARNRNQLTWAPSWSAFNEALSWAAASAANDTPGLLFRRGHGWSAVNYLAGAQDGDEHRQPRAIPHAQWSMLLDRLPAIDAFTIGVAAHLRGLPGISDAAYRVAARCHDTIVAAAAIRAY
jgi:hypothetical protein